MTLRIPLTSRDQIWLIRRLITDESIRCRDERFRLKTNGHHTMEGVIFNYESKLSALDTQLEQAKDEVEPDSLYYYYCKACGYIFAAQFDSALNEIHCPVCRSELDRTCGW